MSLAETQEIMQVVQEIMRLLDGVEIKTTKITEKAPQLEKTVDTFRELERLALRYLTLSQKLGLPSDINQAIEVISRLIVMAKMLQIAYGMMTGGGLGVLIGIAGVTTVALSGLDMVGYDSMRGT